MDIFDRLKRDMGPIGKYAKHAEGYFVFPKLEGEISNRMMFQGKECICWSINSYLGLANHPEVRKADTEAAAKWGYAYPMGARMMSGHTHLHEQLEEECAEFSQKESAYLLNFGYQGIISIIDSLVGKNDVIVYDRDAHACIIDGIRLHFGKRFTYNHNDVESLEKNLVRATKITEQTGGGILVISEGVFGMRGEQGKLREIAALKDKYNFRFMVDDAHGFGTLGANGRGAGEEQGIQDDIDVYFATFAKSMASIGAFVSGDKFMVDYLKYNMRSQMFAKSLAMPVVEGALKRLDMIRTMPELREKLWANVKALQDGLKAEGFDIGMTNSCVTPVYLKSGSTEEAMALVQDIRETHGIFCSMVVYPVIPKGMLLLRLIPTAIHTMEDITETITAFSAVRERLVSGEYMAIGQTMVQG
jgi:glycine C-acetyltransferase